MGIGEQKGIEDDVVAVEDEFEDPVLLGDK